MGSFSSSANFGDLMGTAIFAIVILGVGASWPSVTFLTSLTMVLASVLFALFGRENPPVEYAAIIDEFRGQSVLHD